VKNDTPVESVGTWASPSGDEDALRTASNQEDAEPGGNDLAAMQMKIENTKRQSLDLTKPVHAYLYGLIQTDGHLSQGTRNRGKLQIELSYKDVGMRRVMQKKFWTDKQDRHILSHTVEESAFALQRTERSVKMRLWRLHSSNN
jgi:hypothetical protein